MSASEQAVLCVVGPTAVGKSAIAEDLALALGGEVVSIDSMQVYRGMDIGTAKVPPADRRCPTHMLDIVDVDEAYSVARFQRDARSCIDSLTERGKVSVLCGGTGLYLDAVIDEMSFPPGKIADKGRTTYERMAEEQGAAALHALLAKRDPNSAREIHPNNVRRVIRALEMLDVGVSYADKHQGLKKRAPHYQARIWALDAPRPILYERINTRVDDMFKEGLVDEVAGLVDRGLTTNSTAGMAIGYKEVISALQGTISLEEAKELVKRNTRRYAKRQLSWLRRDGRAHWIDVTRIEREEAVRLICTDWEESRS